MAYLRCFYPSISIRRLSLEKFKLDTSLFISTLHSLCIEKSFFSRLLDLFLIPRPQFQTVLIDLASAMRK